MNRHTQFLHGFFTALIFLAVVTGVLFSVFVVVDLIAGPVGG